MNDNLKSILQNETSRNWLMLSILVGIVLYYFSRETDPVKCYQKGLEKLAHTYGPNDYKVAARWFTDAIALNPSFSEAYYQRGLANHSAFASTLLVHKDQVLSDYTKAIELNPTKAEVYYWRALARNAMQIYDTKDCEALIAYEESVADLQKAISLNPNYTEAIHLLGHWQYCRAEYNEAIKNLNLALNQNRLYNREYGKIELLKELAMAYSKEKKYLKALETYNMIIDLTKEIYHSKLEKSLIEIYKGRIQVKQHLDIDTFEDTWAIEKIEENERYTDYSMPPVGT